MPHEGYADPVTNDGPGFHSSVPVSELIERVTRAIKASDIILAPLVAETMDGVTHSTRPTPTEWTNHVDHGWDKHGQTPRPVETQESAAPGKSTKILSLQPTH